MLSEDLINFQFDQPILDLDSIFQGLILQAARAVRILLIESRLVLCTKEFRNAHNEKVLAMNDQFDEYLSLMLAIPCYFI